MHLFSPLKGSETHFPAQRQLSYFRLPNSHPALGRWHCRLPPLFFAFRLSARTWQTLLLYFPFLEGKPDDKTDQL